MYSNRVRVRDRVRVKYHVYYIIIMTFDYILAICMLYACLCFMHRISMQQGRTINNNKRDGCFLQWLQQPLCHDSTVAILENITSLLPPILLRVCTAQVTTPMAKKQVVFFSGIVWYYVIGNNYIVQTSDFTAHSYIRDVHDFQYQIQILM